jgi:hypothetical protein
MRREKMDFSGFGGKVQEVEERKMSFSATVRS